MWLVLPGVMVISSTLRLCWPARVVNPRESSSYLQGFHWWKHHEQLGCVSLEPISSENDLWLSTSRTVCGFVDSGVSCSLCCEQISIQILSPFKIWREHSSKLKSSLPGFFCFVFFFRRRTAEILLLAILPFGKSSQAVSRFDMVICGAAGFHRLKMCNFERSAYHVTWGWIPWSIEVGILFLFQHVINKLSDPRLIPALLAVNVLQVQSWRESPSANSIEFFLQNSPRVDTNKKLREKTHRKSHLGNQTESKSNQTRPKVLCPEALVVLLALHWRVADEVWELQLVVAVGDLAWLAFCERKTEGKKPAEEKRMEKLLQSRPSLRWSSRWKCCCASGRVLHWVMIPC